MPAAAARGTIWAMSAVFRVARNPEPDSTLPFLLSVPVEGAPLLLKAKSPWPRTAKVYCHRASEWPDDAELIEEVAVRVCRRRGRAVDLVLDRGRENRSQFVFATIRGRGGGPGREAIFWQTARTAAGARPGVRIPSRRASGLTGMTVLVDTRERYGYRFATQQVSVERRALPAGDYAVACDGELVAAVERKSVADLARSLVDGSLGFAMAELAALPNAAVVVDGAYAQLFRLEHVTPGFVADLVARLAVRYPSVPVVFAGTRKLAEEWTYRFLGAALAEARGEALHGDPTEPRASS